MRYPTDLPDVPADRWNARLQGVISEELDHAIHAFLRWTIDADSAEQAERRALAVQHYDYEDDLEGASAVALQTNGVWSVVIALKPSP